MSVQRTSTSSSSITNNPHYIDSKSNQSSSTSNSHSLASHNQRNHIYLRNHVSRSRSKTYGGKVNCISLKSSQTVSTTATKTVTTTTTPSNNNDHIHIINEDAMNDIDRKQNNDDLLNGNIGNDDISCGNLDRIVPSVKRNKRAYSTHIEREKYIAIKKKVN